MDIEKDIPERTREDIISDHSPHAEYNMYYHEHAILEMLSDYAIQEKHKEVLGLLTWISDNEYEYDPEDKYWYKLEDDPFRAVTHICKTHEELYGLYLTYLQIIKG